MFRMYASNSHSYTHLILALVIVRKPTVWGLFITSEYPGIYDIGLSTSSLESGSTVRPSQRRALFVEYHLELHAAAHVLDLVHLRGQLPRPVTASCTISCRAGWHR